jgi:hypothetical protein
MTLFSIKWFRLAVVQILNGQLTIQISNVRPVIKIWFKLKLRIPQPELSGYRMFTTISIFKHPTLNPPTHLVWTLCIKPSTLNHSTMRVECVALRLKMQRRNPFPRGEKFIWRLDDYIFSKTQQK